MRNCRKTLGVAMLVMICLPAFAQQDTDELDERMREAEQRLIERERDMDKFAREMEVQRAERERFMRDENIKVEIRMREAEASLAQAAQQVAELSIRQWPRVATIERILRSGHGPLLGVTIGSDDNEGPVAGVTILGVSPGGAAGEAGLRAGDVITSINSESLTADNGREANEKLLDFMRGVEEGDELTVEYLRNGKSMSTEVAPRRMRGGVFAFEFDRENFVRPDIHVAPQLSQFKNRFFWIGGGSGLGDMELVMLTERLGSYFGTDEGLLIVRAPKNEDLKLQDGDVIQSIDGRKPSSVNHAMRILGSYQSGETLNIEIMRDQRKQKISIEVPDDRHSAVAPLVVPKVQIVVPKMQVVVPRIKVVTVPEDRMS
ncbi:MAG: PDZ domain-containing protein [Gammaproteobacteria bacterium]|nr:MAG: PDZ domain-containing protein [Gammaproteobacteria bacterium]